MADGINYKEVATKWPASGDKPVFVSIAKTPYGYHALAGDKWDESVGVRYVRHLFSKDLKNWKVLEWDSASRNTNYYKVGHLRYNPEHGRLYAFSSCASTSAYGWLAWIYPRDYSTKSVRRYR